MCIVYSSRPKAEHNHTSMERLVIFLSNIVIHVPIIIISPNVLPICKAVDLLLDLTNIWLEVAFDSNNGLRDQDLICHTLPTLHDPDDSRIEQISSILLNLVISRLGFFGLGLLVRTRATRAKEWTWTYRLLLLNRVDVYPTIWICEIGIVHELIVIVHVLPWWHFLQHALLTTSKRL